MHGYSHAVTGAAGWLAVTSSSAAALSLYPVPGEVMIAGSLLCAGAAMAPDADHEHASIAHSLPPFSKWVAEGIGAVSGGHRHGTHSIIGIFAAGAVAYVSSLLLVEIQGRDVAVGSAIIALLLAAFATKVLGVYRGFFGRGAAARAFADKVAPWLVTGVVVGLIAWHLDYKWEWLPVCMMIGCYMHIWGDSLTVQGVPWLWPWNPRPPRWLTSIPFLGRVVRVLWQNNGYFRVPVLGKTGEKVSKRENALVVLASTYIMYLVAYEVLALVGLPDVLL